MRTTIIIVMLLLLTATIIAQEEQQQQEQITNPEEINSMNADDLAAAIAQGRIDPSMVQHASPEVLLDAMTAHPDIIATIGDQDFTRALNTEPELIRSNQQVRADLERRAQSNIGILNGNPGIKQQWFATYDITDTGADLASFDGRQATTLGSQGTTFDIAVALYLPEGSQAKVLPTGALVLDIAGERLRERVTGSVTIAGATSVMASGEGGFNLDIQGGKASFTGIETFQNIHMQNGILQYKGFVYGSPEGNLDMTIGQNEINLKGEIYAFRESRSIMQLPEEQIFESRKAFFLNGEMTIAGVTGSHRILKAGSTYTTYGNVEQKPLPSPRTKTPDDLNRDGKSLTITVSEDTDVYDVHYALSGNTFIEDAPPIEACTRSCIIMKHKTEEGAYKGWLAMKAMGNNNIDVTLHDYSLNFVDVERITDMSKVTFSDGGRVAYHFSNDQLNPFTVEGNIALGSAEINYQFEKDGKLFNQYVRYQEGKSVVGVCPSGAACAEVARINNDVENPRQHVTHIAADATSGQTATCRGAADTSSIACAGYTAQDIPFISLEDTDVLVLTGHHYTGDDKIWGENGEVVFDQLPPSTNIEAIMFSACHTVMNPEYEEAKAEEFLQTMEGLYPNAEVIIGYDTRAPLHDETIWTNSMRALSTAENYDTYAREVLASSEKQLAGARSDRNAQGSWTYDQESAIEGKRMGIYVKQSDGTWKFYTNQYPNGIAVTSGVSQPIAMNP
ncbi:hypothetical protein HY488_00715 [Candidatus Woesearchaeota archaeon]|nr:hypothetical protein [Candidatus Woesearchaeota archaeon]